MWGGREIFSRPAGLQEVAWLAVSNLSMYEPVFSIRASDFYPFEETSWRIYVEWYGIVQTVWSKPKGFEKTR